jgi:two-component system sensor histidine kinase UhpB
MSRAESRLSTAAPTIVAVGAWLYCLGLAIWLFSHWQGVEKSTFITAWWVLPTHLAGIGLVAARIARGDLVGPRRLGWWLLLVSIATEAVATGSFGYLYDTGADTFGVWVDVIYLANYAFMAAVCAAFFVACGGDFRRRRVWLDGVTLAVGLVATMLPFLLTPVIAPDYPNANEALATIAYALGIVAIATMGGLLVIQIGNWRDELPVLLIVAGFFIGLVTDVWVDAGAVRGLSLQTGLANLVSCCYGALFATAAALRTPAAPPPANAPEDAVGNVYGFVPVLTILVAITLVLGTQVSQSGINLVATAVLVLVGAALLFVRQRLVRDELRRLNRELAVRQADARLTELVRRSSDAIAVVDAAGRVSYLSPASTTVLGADSAALVGTRAALLLGDGNAAALEAFIGELSAHQARPTELELEVAAPDGRARAVQIVGSDQMHNPLIDGTVLTLRDVTAQRELEREVLEVATRERQRLSSDIHEGLGQQLTGVALLLQGAGSSRGGDVEEMRARLQTVIGHVNSAIEGVRTVARGLSPLQVVRGSLATALEQLAAETRERSLVAVVLQNDLIDDPVTDVAADHLYRIVRDAITTATRRSGCTRIGVRLASAGDRLTLTVSDDGRGPVAGDAPDDLELRMIGYRARLLGGSVRLERPPGGDGRCEVTIPLHGTGAATATD